VHLLYAAIGGAFGSTVRDLPAGAMNEARARTRQRPIRRKYQRLF
jgi:fluoride ion exporter CrcB/FEX